jgi:hypothetical protein
MMVYLRSFALFYSHSEYFVAIWYFLFCYFLFFPRFDTNVVGTKKNLATLLFTQRYLAKGRFAKDVLPKRPLS